MAKTRLSVPRQLSLQVLYKSAKTCCVCREPGKPVEIHHIDEDPANNVEENLIGICRNCHDEAHTTHRLSQNLTPDRLRGFKSQWEAEVANRSSAAMLPRSNLDQAMWTFVNHQRLPGVMAAVGTSFDHGLINYLFRAGVVDNNGIPIFQRGGRSSGLTTIYDRFEWDDAQRLHLLYTRAVDSLIQKVKPIELGAIWTKTEMQQLLRPGDFAFCLRGFLFKSGGREQGEEDRVVYARANGIEVRFLANTRHMYGSSALYDSFSGNRFAAVLLLVREVAKEGALVVIRATPLAMGAGFVPSSYKTPHRLRYGWAKGV